MLLLFYRRALRDHYEKRKKKLKKFWFPVPVWLRPCRPHPNPRRDFYALLSQQVKVNIWFLIRCTVPKSFCCLFRSSEAEKRDSSFFLDQWINKIDLKYLVFFFSFPVVFWILNWTCLFIRPFLWLLSPLSVLWLLSLTPYFYWPVWWTGSRRTNGNSSREHRRKTTATEPNSHGHPPGAVRFGGYPANGGTSIAARQALSIARGCSQGWSWTWSSMVHSRIPHQRLPPHP